MFQLVQENNCPISFSRVVLPLSVEEYQVGQLWSVAEASKAETGGGEGVEVLKNEPFDNVPLLNGQFNKGQYTHKIYHLQSWVFANLILKTIPVSFRKVPSLIRKIAPKGSLAIHEEAWNAYPYCKTVITNPDYMKENFYVKIETIHLPDNGTTENVSFWLNALPKKQDEIQAHGLKGEELAKREIVNINIANDHEFLNSGDLHPDTTPSKFQSTKTGR